MSGPTLVTGAGGVVYPWRSGSLRQRAKAIADLMASSDHRDAFSAVVAGDAARIISDLLKQSDGQTDLLRTLHGTSTRQNDELIEATLARAGVPVVKLLPDPTPTDRARKLFGATLALLLTAGVTPYPAEIPPACPAYVGKPHRPAQRAGECWVVPVDGLRAISKGRA